MIGPHTSLLASLLGAAGLAASQPAATSAPPVASAAVAGFAAPSSLRPFQQVGIPARGLPAGARYTLSIGFRVGGTQTVCQRPFSTATVAADGTAHFFGFVPHELRCVLPDGSQVSRAPLVPARGRAYALSACVALPGAQCDGRHPLLRRPVRVLAAGGRCGTIGFTPQSDDAASSIRASGVDCLTARRVASASKRPSNLCFAGGSCRYSTIGFACTGRVMQDALPAVVWECRRGSARVSFLKT